MYQVQLQNFEGPLDLLLFFIKRDELDIYDIPISYITRQFLEYIRFLEELDLAVASEFIYMASTLMAIKARMMLPGPEEDEESMDEDDPRYELVQALLEYKRYKEVAEDMAHMDHSARLSYTRGYSTPDRIEPEPKGESLREVTLVDMMAAFKNVMNKVAEEHYHSISRFETDLETQSGYVLAQLRRFGRRSFMELCQGFKSRIYVIITFLAVLELVKENQLLLFLSRGEPGFFVEIPNE